MNSWGASIIDTLDTILLMGFNDEYNLCRPHINQLNFHWVNGRDWAEGYVSPNHGTKADQTDDDNDDDDSDASGGSEKERLPLAISRDRTTGLAVFETGIRYLGGMLGAYDLSGDELLVDRAVELAEILSKAFNTDSGLPVGRIDPGSDSLLRLGQVSIAEVGSMTLELVRLSQVTGDRKWFDFAQRAMDYIEQRVIPRGTYEPLIPLWFMPDQALETPMNGVLAFGGLADSYYEYLIKAYKLLGGSSAAEQYSRIYERSIDRARKTIYLDIDVVPGRDLLAIGKLENGRLIPEIEHLTCFAGAMLGLGARLLDRKTDLRDAERFTQSCYWLSAATPTGLQPEVVEFFDMENPAINGGSMYENITLEEGFPHHPFHGRIDVDEEIEAKRVNRDRNDVLRWAGDGTPVEPDDGGRTEEGPVEYYSRLRGSPPGARKVVGRGINRPETIESIFYM
jgi:mannosyl-oligosaccharide alpha-1,2-mannosidase